MITGRGYGTFVLAWALSLGPAIPMLMPQSVNSTTAKEKLNEKAGPFGTTVASQGAGFQTAGSRISGKGVRATWMLDSSSRMAGSSSPLSAVPRFPVRRTTLSSIHRRCIHRRCQFWGPSLRDFRSTGLRFHQMVERCESPVLRCLPPSYQ